MSVVGTDCPINEPWPFEKKWYSQKFNGQAEYFSTLLYNDKGVEVDGGCRGNTKIKHPEIGFDYNGRKEKSCVPGIQKNVNGCLKQLNILNTPFWCSGDSNKMMEKHGLSFTAIAVITQLKFDAWEDVLYDIKCDNTHYF
eukprot:6144482-Ditylum_brightwellii.AAC.1